MPILSLHEVIESMRFPAPLVLGAEVSFEVSGNKSAALGFEGFETDEQPLGFRV